jgi:hypothetical protein
MKIQEHFDPSQIVKIRFTPERPTSFRWVEAKPEIRTFFGLRVKQKATPAGFIDSDSYFENRFYTEEELKNYGYKVCFGFKHTVYNKSHVSIYLKHKLEVYRTFENEEEALAWIEELKATSGRDFEVITH